MALAAALALASIAGCGKDNNAAQAPAAIAATPATATTPAPTTTTPAATTPAAKPAKPRPPKDVPDAIVVPPDATGAGLPKVPSQVGLSLASASSAALQWQVTAKTAKAGKDLCVRVHSHGNADPEPNCAPGTLMALQFFTDTSLGAAVGTASPIAADRSSAPSGLLVSGLARPDVDRVNVLYDGKKFPAQVTSDAVTLPVNKAFAKSVSGETAKQLDGLPDGVTLRIFAVELPLKAGSAPPVTVTPTTKQPVHGAVTLQLS